jgi:hypothetical protein
LLPSLLSDGAHFAVQASIACYRLKKDDENLLEELPRRQKQDPHSNLFQLHRSPLLHIFSGGKGITFGVKESLSFKIKKKRRKINQKVITIVIPLILHPAIAIITAYTPVGNDRYERRQINKDSSEMDFFGRGNANYTGFIGGNYQVNRFWFINNRMETDNGCNAANGRK